MGNPRLEKTYVPHIKDKLQVLNRSNYLLLLMCLFASSRKTRESSMPTYSITANTSIPHQIKVEEYLGIRFTKCRDIHFYESQTLSLGDYTTLISFEVPTESLILLLEQSSKLPSYGEFTRNARHFTFLEQVVKDIDWWKPAQLKNAVSSIKSLKRDNPRISLLEVKKL